MWLPRCAISVPSLKRLSTCCLASFHGNTGTSKSPGHFLSCIAKFIISSYTLGSNNECVDRYICQSSTTNILHLLTIHKVLGGCASSRGCGSRWFTYG